LYHPSSKNEYIKIFDIYYPCVCIHKRSHWQIYKYKTYVCLRQYTRIQENARYWLAAETTALQMLLDSLTWLIQIFRFSEELKARINHIKKSCSCKTDFSAECSQLYKNKKNFIFKIIYVCCVCNNFTGYFHCLILSLVNSILYIILYTNTSQH